MPANQRDDPAAEPDEAVPVPVAARRLGKSPDAIRSAIKRGKLSARLGNDGRWSVFLPAGAAAAEAVEFDSLQPIVDRLRTALEQALVQSADRATTVADLRERVGRLEGEAMGHADRVQDLHNALADLAARLDRSTAELADARRSWLERVLAALRR